MAATTKETYRGSECKVEIFIDQDDPGAAPGSSLTAWTDAITAGGVHEVFVAQSVEANASTEVTRINGMNQRRPYGTKEGNIDYTWSLDTLYTIDTYDDDGVTATSYDILELIDKDGEGSKFAMLITMQDASGDSSGASAVKYIELTGCNTEESNFSVGTDSDAGVSLSGAAEDRNILTPA